MTELNIMEAMLDEGQDNALMRFTMGSAFIKHGKYEQAITQLAKAVELKPDYAAAWLKYAQALLDSGQVDESVSVLKQGMTAVNASRDEKTFAEMQELLNGIQT